LPDRRTRQAAPSRAPLPEAEPKARRRRPDAVGVRMVVGLAGLASASALTTAMLPSILPQPAAVAAVADSPAPDPTQTPEPSVIHVTHVVTLAPGETLPPDVLANQPPANPTPTPQATPKPTPRIVYQVVTRQSGKP
jgi:hypothetical protein